MQMISVICPACHSRYSVPVTMVGKQAKCTKCGGAIAISAGSESPAGPAPAVQEWYVLVNGQQLGPITKEALDQYASQGQLPPQAQVRRSDQSHWQPITHLYPHLAQLPPMEGLAGYLAQLQTAQQQAQPSNPYAAPQSMGGYRAPRRGGGLPGILIAMCVTVFVLTGLGLIIQTVNLFQAGDEETIRQLRAQGQSPGAVEGRLLGQRIGFGLDILLSLGKIAGAILLLYHKAVGRILLKVCTIVSLVFLILAGTCMLFGLGMLGSVAGGAPVAVMIVIMLLVFSGFGAYYWFILSTLARDDVIAALE